MPVVIVPTRQEGLTIFPTHRIAARVEAAAAAGGRRSNGDDRAVAEVYTRAGARATCAASRASSTPSWSAAIAADVGYTPYADEARAAVDARRRRGRASCSAPPTVEQVARGRQAAARRMPQKSTFFYPKLTSGLLFLPLD